MLENSRSANRHQVDVGFTYSDKEWDSIRQLLNGNLGWDADVETLPSNTIDVRTRERIPGPLRLILENAARSQQIFDRISSSLKDDKAAIRKGLRSMYDWIDKTRANCEEIIGAAIPGVDVTNLENVMLPCLSELASCCAQEIEALRYRPEGNRNADKGVNDYLSELAEIWDQVEADPKLKLVWRRKFMTLAATPFLGPDTGIMVESWSRRQQRKQSAILKA